MGYLFLVWEGGFAKLCPVEDFEITSAAERELTNRTLFFPGLKREVAEGVQIVMYDGANFPKGKPHTVCRISKGAMSLLQERIDSWDL